MEIVKKLSDTLNDEDKEKIQRAVDAFASADLYLVEHDLYECTVSHRFACHLHKEFSPQWHVDCEYNKIEDEPKIYRAIRSIAKKVVQGKLSRKFAALLHDTCYELEEAEFEIFRREAFPDIIIHRRGETDPGNNLLVIEIKVDRAADAMDDVKLVEFTRGLVDGKDLLLKYRFGLFLRFHKPQIAGDNKIGKVTGTLYSAGDAVATLEFPYSHHYS